MLQRWMMAPALALLASSAMVLGDPGATHACSEMPEGWGLMSDSFTPPGPIPVNGAVELVLWAEGVDHTALDGLSLRVTDGNGDAVSGSTSSHGLLPDSLSEALVSWTPDEALEPDATYTMIIDGAWQKTVSFTTSDGVLSEAVPSPPTVGLTRLIAAESLTGAEVCCATESYRASCEQGDVHEICFQTEVAYHGQLVFQPNVVGGAPGQFAYVVTSEGVETVFPSTRDFLSVIQGELAARDFCVDVAVKRLSDGVVSAAVPVCVHGDEVEPYVPSTEPYAHWRCVGPSYAPGDPPPTEPLSRGDTDGSPNASGDGSGCQMGEGTPSGSTCLMVLMVLALLRRRGCSLAT